MIKLQELTLQRGTKILFDHASATIFARQKIGLIGINGCGKSSLFSLLLKEIEPDGGELFVQENLQIVHLSQETPNSDLPAIEYVMQGDKELIEILEKINQAEIQHDGILISELHSRLFMIDGYSAKSRAGKLLNGLGFHSSEHEKRVNEFSGGWRMRLNLAQALMSRSDVLLLDEPTNHLDLDAIIWLEYWLKNYAGILLLISHDREFLDNVVTRVLHVENRTLNSYTGNYSDFETQRAIGIAQQQAQYEKQQAKIESTMEFVHRFGAKASKARQAQSRMKALEKMELVAAAQVNSLFSFKFKDVKKITSPLLQLDHVDIGYDQNIILKDVNKTICPDARIGLLGPNGAGKSTLIKCMVGILTPIDGSVNTSGALKIGYFAQHQVDQLNLSESPVWHLQQIDTKTTEQQFRKFLGGFNFNGDMALSPITNFSGGEKARLVLAILVWQAPNLLLLDEPTNHLDLEMREALNLALQKYAGALVLVSHDRHLLRTTAEELWLVHDSKVGEFDGDLESYKNWVLEMKQQETTVKSQLKVKEKNVNENVVKENNVEISDYECAKIKRSMEAKIKKIESKIDILHQEKLQIEAELEFDHIYHEANKHQLDELLLRNKDVKDQIANLEKEWESATNLLTSNY